jgi:lysophospholipase L1-like esterase
MIAVFLGTSVTTGGFPTYTASRLGWTVVNQGVGGSGYARAPTFRSRIATVTAANPDVIVIEGGINDVPEVGVSLAALTAEVPLFFAALRAAHPTIPIYVLSPQRTGRVLTDIVAAMAVIRAGALAYSCTYVLDWMYWITGTGNVAAPTGDGNADLYINADGIHPSAAGTVFLGDKLASVIRPQFPSVFTAQLGTALSVPGYLALPTPEHVAGGSPPPVADAANLSPRRP